MKIIKNLPDLVYYNLYILYYNLDLLHMPGTMLGIGQYYSNKTGGIRLVLVLKQ